MKSPIPSLMLVFGVLLPFLGCGGGGGSKAVTPAPSGTLALSGFSPASGLPGTSATLTGSGFGGIAYVKLGGLACATTAISDTQVKITVPAGASLGAAHFVAGNVDQTVVSPTTFTVLNSGGPAVAGFNPLRGSTGDTVTISGSGFTGTSAVYFGGQAAIFVQNSDNLITAYVPSLAPSGSISVIAGGITSASSKHFLVSSVAPSLDLSIDGLYLTQSVQSYEGTVPLVANRKAMLRVFAKANLANAASATIRVRLLKFPTGAVVDAWDLQAGSSVPTLPSEGTLSSSWNALVPGAEILAGTYLVAEVDPLNELSETDKSNNTFRFPASGAMDIRAVKAWKVTLVPVTQQGITGNVTDSSRTAASWVDRLQRMYPMDSIDVKVRSSALATTGNLNAGATGTVDDTGWKQALQDLAKARAVEAQDRYYFGAINVNYAGGLAGLGYVGSPSAIGWDKHIANGKDGYNYPEVLAHEVGHNFGRYHAPCGVTDADANWPTAAVYATAFTGAWGWDPGLGLTQAALKDPALCKDIMSYCDGNLWVSNYTYGDATTDPASPAASGGSALGGILAFRAASALGDVQEAQDCLMVSGRVRNGRVEIESSFQVRTLPTPVQGGAYALVLQDEAGQELGRTRFEPVALADARGSEESHFLVVMPLDAGKARSLAGLQIHRGGALMASRRSSERALAVVREPVAMAMKAGQAHLSWDADAHRQVMVRDPRTGEVLGFLEGGSAMFETDARELEFTLSDGVRSQRRTLKVLE